MFGSFVLVVSTILFLDFNLSNHMTSNQDFFFKNMEIEIVNKCLEGYFWIYIRHNKNNRWETQL